MFGTEITPGSYNFFAKAIVHEDKIRKDISTSEDDEFIFNVVSKIKSSLGFIGYTIYDEHNKKLNAISTDSESGSVQPNNFTISFVLALLYPDPNLFI